MDSRDFQNVRVRISKPGLQENEAQQIFRKTNIYPDTRYDSLA